MGEAVAGVGVVGYGKAAKIFHLPLLQAEPRLALRAIASRRESVVRAEHPEVATVSTIEALVERSDIDVVVIAGRNQDHFPQASIALQAGKHVVIEKPMTVSVAEAEALLALATKNGCLVMPFHNRRWDNGLLEFERLLKGNDLGQMALCALRFDRFVPTLAGQWREDPLPGGGMLYDLGSHLLFASLHLFGLPDALQADVFPQREHALVDDYFDITLWYGNLRTRLTSSMLLAANDLVIEAHGTRGSYRKYFLDPQAEMLKQGLLPGTEAWKSFPGKDFSIRSFVDDSGVVTEQDPEFLKPGRYDEFYRGVAGAILDGDEPPVSSVLARNVIALIEASFRSSREGRRLSRDELLLIGPTH